MDTARFQHAAAAVQAAFAQALACAPAAFATEQLTIVDRPDPPAWPYTALLVTCGTGTVLSLDRSYRAFVEAQAPDNHVNAMAPPFLQGLIEEGQQRGATLQTKAPGLCFTLAEPPGAVALPAGLTLRLVDADWMAEEMPRRRFENGVGERGVAARELRNQFAAVLFEAGGEPVAVAGTFLTYGLLEIGVDVIRPWRGSGLAPIVVRAAVAEILARGAVPFYGCAATNVRSHRTALAIGFLPVCSETYVIAVARHNVAAL
jgi:hypothetical protein